MSELDIHPAILKHLNEHQLCCEDEVINYLLPTLKDLPSPFLLKSVDTAVDIIIESIKNNDDLIIWGDYDVDGITGTSLLHSFFKQLGITSKCHIPNRLTDGYGLNDKVLRDFATTLAPNKLLITVDCGIANSEELILAKKYGFKTIVTDHHQVPESTLYADATINPKQEGCKFPFSDLSGVGVAFYLASAVRSKIMNSDRKSNFNIPNMKSFLSYVAIGTIADIMPLNGVNRVLVKGGFESLADTRDEGLRALCSTLDINRNRMTSDAVSYRIAPAINAAGRLGESGTPLKLFLAESEAEANECAAHLVQLNNKRRQITEQNFDTALTVARKELLQCSNCLVLVGDFHEGVIGIVASKLVEEFQIPALVCCYQPSDRSLIKGSGRAPAGYDLYGLIAGAARYLKKYGGHELAAGFSLPVDNFIQFKETFCTLLLSENKEKARDYSSLKANFINLSVSESLNRSLLDNLMQLEPTGEANPKPIFVDRKVRFVSYSTFGKNRSHLKGVVRGKYQNVPVIGFNLADKIATVNLREECCLVYSHSLDFFNGKSTWKIHIKDLTQS